MNNSVRVRFAPSPTGPLHMGGVRTALFNYLFAKKHNGTFILRIEDTDQMRYVGGAEEYIVNALEWCGLSPDEGIHSGGPFAPYRQSERSELYKEYASKLINSGHAYYAFDTPSELDAIRTSYESEKKSFSYDASVRLTLNNSLALSDEEIKRHLNEGTPYVVRFKMPENEQVEAQDLIRDKVVFKTDTLDDKVIFKSDGLPTYHLANVVDDHLMEISHVIRGEEWLPSLPLHILLYKALGWENEMPRFAHLPLILKPAGKGKLSKRDGDKMGFPVFPLQWEDPATKEISSGYRESGYFPEAFTNMLALLGWHPEGEQEIFSMQELIESFSLERVGKSGSRFDPEKAKWFNQQYLRNLPEDKINQQFTEYLQKKGVNAHPDFTGKICEMLKERAVFIADIYQEGQFFFEAPSTYDEKVVRKRWKNEVPEHIKSIQNILRETEPFTAAVIKENISEYITKNELGFGAIMNALRLTIVGSSKGPDLMEIMSLLGKDETLNRVANAIRSLSAES